MCVTLRSPHTAIQSKMREEMCNNEFVLSAELGREIWTGTSYVLILINTQSKRENEQKKIKLKKKWRRSTEKRE